MHKEVVLNFAHTDLSDAFDDTPFEDDLSEVAFEEIRRKRIMLIVALGLSLGLWAGIWFGVCALFGNAPI